MIKFMVKSVIVIMMIVFGYNHRYKIMNAVLRLEQIRNLVVTQSMKFPKGSISYIQR